MPKLLNGVFDNRDTMQREAWKDGELAAQWPAAMCATFIGAETLMPWERKALEDVWGQYPAPPSAPL